jgi:hypothetical protein
MAAVSDGRLADITSPANLPVDVHGERAVVCIRDVRWSKPCKQRFPCYSRRSDLSARGRKTIVITYTIIHVK